MTNKTLVLAIGNTLLSDEGAGIHVLRHLQQGAPDLSDVEYLDGGTLGFTLAIPVADADNLVVLDAARMGCSPGTVRVYMGNDMDAFLGAGRRTPHEVSTSDILAMAQLQGRLPGRRALVGIEPENLDWGEQPSPAVRKAVPDAARAVARLLEEWHPGYRWKN